ncbi:hypothetical protein LJC68_04720, partial [Bacteroidales bacterium OttesenSCG-928-B11]|nr:hypothetical protein [Bacteroidales bacterium OttesenSCG-928-B11]
AAALRDAEARECQSLDRTVGTRSALQKGGEQLRTFILDMTLVMPKIKGGNGIFHVPPFILASLSPNCLNTRTPFLRVLE